jgi:hypothetical protein
VSNPGAGCCLEGQAPNPEDGRTAIGNIVLAIRKGGRGTAQFLPRILAAIVFVLQQI